MDVNIWNVWGQKQPVSSALDTKADGNFIADDLVEKLGYRAPLQPYTGEYFRTACGGKVHPHAQTVLRWNTLRNTKTFEDTFLVVASDRFDLVYGVGTIHERRIYERNPEFNILELKPIGSNKPHLTSVRRAVLTVHLEAEASASDIATAQSNARVAKEKADRAEEIRASYQSPTTAPTGRPATAWSEWTWNDAREDHFSHRVNEQGEDEYIWFKDQ
jgi:hypothetical protein